MKFNFRIILRSHWPHNEGSSWTYRVAQKVQRMFLGNVQDIVDYSRKVVLAHLVQSGSLSLKKFNWEWKVPLTKTSNTPDLFQSRICDAYLSKCFLSCWTAKRRNQHQLKDKLKQLYFNKLAFWLSKWLEASNFLLQLKSLVCWLTKIPTDLNINFFNGVQKAFRQIWVLLK